MRHLKSLADRDSNSIDVWRCPSCDHFHSDTNNHICGSVFTLAHLLKSLVHCELNSIGFRRCPFCDHLNSDTNNHICGGVSLWLTCKMQAFCSPYAV
ncbi:hypothetical protein KSF78_0005584 [Schistosoma japonicum]|nr:hypothetical protein KSF78_0005584 [Schistosoma japonicum]